MTRSEKRAIEIWSNDIAYRLGFPTPSVSLSKKYDRMEIRTGDMDGRTTEEFAEKLDKKLSIVAGWRCDVWAERPGLTFVKYKEKHDKSHIQEEILEGHQDMGSNGVLS